MSADYCDECDESESSSIKKSNENIKLFLFFLFFSKKNLTTKKEKYILESPQSVIVKPFQFISFNA